MACFIEKKTLARFDEDMHGARIIQVRDPAFVATEENPRAPMVDVPNPDCKIPAGAVEITKAQLLEVTEAINSGKVVTFKDDVPVISEPPPVSKDELMRRHRIRRTAMLSHSDGKMASDAPAEHLAKWGAYRKALRDWPATIKDPKNPPPLPQEPV